MRVSALLALLSLATWSSPAWSQEAAEPAPPEEEKASLAWSGRVFVGDELSRVEDNPWRNQQGVNSARVGVKFEHPEGLSTVVKLELGDGKAELKDGYLRLDSEVGFRLQAGRFKKPISSIALASRWDLPSIERGILSSLSADGQDLAFAGGRVDGVLLRYRPALGWKTTLSVSAFQNDLAEAAPNSKDRFGQDFYLRASVKPFKGLEFASTVAMLGHVSDPDPDPTQSLVEHAKFGSLEMSYKGRWLQAWIEGFAGQSLFPRVVGEATSGNFLAARALLAARLRPGTPQRLRPFVSASYFDPRSGDDDSNSEIQAGASLGFSKIWRLQFEFVQGFATGDLAAQEVTAIRVQLAARFKE
jgi:hypothetical protein